jgi:glucokinase
MSAARFACLDIGGTKLAAAVVTGDGTIGQQLTVPTGAADGAGAVLDRAVALLREVLTTERREHGAPSAIGVSTNGLTRPDGVDLAPSVPGWSELRIPARLRLEFPGLPCAIVNDVKSGAEAELAWGELRGVGTGLYLNFGTGVAAAIVAGGQVLQGAHGAAGEIGYLLPGTAALTGRPGQAPLEDLIGGRGVAEWASAELGRPATMADLVRSAGTGDDAEVLYDRLADQLALWTVNLTIMIDPERVVIGGGLVRTAAEPVLDRLRAAIGRAAPFPAEVVRARFGADSALVGAAAVALRLDQAHVEADLP